MTMSRAVITDPTGTPALGLTGDLLAALRECLAFSSRDWSREADLAWLYGIVLGWDDPDEADADATDEVAARFGWDASKVARLRALRAVFAKLGEAERRLVELAAREERKRDWYAERLAAGDGGADANRA